MTWTTLSKGLAFTTVLLAASARSQSANGTQGSSWKEGAWFSLPASKELKWVDCYPGFQCTRFEVPLDYNDPNGKKAELPLVRLPANVSSDSKDHLGPIFFNPGGPGGSGVNMIVASGNTYRKFLGPNFDLIGFDPRGVGRATPVIEFFKTPIETFLGSHPATELNNSVNTVSSHWANSVISGTSAFQNNGDVLRHMTSENSARDILEMNKAFGKDKVNFWGISYGSILGSVFASMFPDKVERLIIDGVVDSDDYFSTTWTSGIKDVDKTINWFFKSCLEAGAEDCAFYESSIEGMEQKLQGIWNTLAKGPIPIFATEPYLTYGLVDYATVRQVLYSNLYNPFTVWRTVATYLGDLAKGNARTFYSLYLATPANSTSGSLCVSGNSSSTIDPNLDIPIEALKATPQALITYLCNDGEAVPPGVDEAERHYQESIKAYPTYGSYWAAFRMLCSGWSTELPKPKFTGASIGGKTSFPMLIIGNTADPATAIAGAQKAQQRFEGSVLLTFDAPGHGSRKAPSKCIDQAIGDYFVKGTLPKEGTICPIDEGVSPFDNPEAPKKAQGALNVSEVDDKSFYQQPWFIASASITGVVILVGAAAGVWACTHRKRKSTVASEAAFVPAMGAYTPLLDETKQGRPYSDNDTSYRPHARSQSGFDD